MKYFGFIFLLIAPIVAGVHIRLQPEFLPITHDWARGVVFDEIRNQIITQIEIEQPNLPHSKKMEVVDKSLDQYVLNNFDKVNERINELADHYKESFQDEKGSTYIPDIDPYHFLRHARNVINHGYIGDTIRENGQMYDETQIYPHGFKLGFDVHPHILANFYRVSKVFRPQISLVRAAAYLPVVFMIICTILFFLFLHGRVGEIGAFTATMVFVTNHTYLARSLWGHADTDAYNVLFPIVLMWLFTVFIDRETSLKKCIALALSIGLVIGIYSVTWGGWWFMLNIFTLILLCIAAYHAFARNWKTLKNVAMRFGLFFVSTGLFITITKGFKPFWRNFIFAGSVSFSQIKNDSATTLWPNVLRSVSELAELPMAETIALLTEPAKNSNLMFMMMLVGLSLLLVLEMKDKLKALLAVVAYYTLFFYVQESFYHNVILFCILMVVPLIGATLYALYKKEDLPNLEYVVMFAVWLLATFYASTKGVRFGLLMAPIYAALIGIFAQSIYQAFDEFALTNFRRKKKWQWAPLVATLILIFALFTPHISAAKNLGKSDIPHMNDAWFNLLNKIKVESSPDSVITSWWDFGHMFRFYANRPVTFDGASQNFPQAHFVGKMLMTGDETLAIGTLRMMHCKAQHGFREVFNETYDHPRTMDILYRVVVEDKTTARSILEEEGLSKSAIENTLGMTHCIPPESYFIVSGDMVDKTGSFGSFGNWDFDRAQQFFDVKKEKTSEEAITRLVEGHEMSEAEATQTFKLISPLKHMEEWATRQPHYATTKRVECGEVDAEGNFECVHTVFKRPLTLEVNRNLNTVNAVTSTQTEQVMHFGFVENTGTVFTHVPGENNFAYSALFIQNESGSFSSLIMDDWLLEALFTRLYFVDGAGLKHFELFSKEKDLKGDYVIAYKINWDGTAQSEKSIETSSMDEMDSEPQLDEIEEEESTDLTSIIDLYT